MAQEIVLRKRSRDGNKVCTTYGIAQPSYKFILETCEEVEAVIKDSKGMIVSVLNQSVPSSVISKKGNYNICIEGAGVGTLYAEWSSAPPVDCCDELREAISRLEQEIAQLDPACCEELRREIENLDERVTALEEGGGSGGCCEELRGRLTIVENKLNGMSFLATYNTTTAQEILAHANSDNEPFAPFLLKRGNDYHVVTSIVKLADNKVNIRAISSAGGEFYVYMYTITDGTWSTATYGLQGKLTAGDNITINNGVISATGGGGGLPSDFDINAGDNVQVAKSGNAYTVSSSRMFAYRVNVSAPDGGMAEGIGFYNPNDNKDQYTIQAGDNTTLSYTSENRYARFIISSNDTKTTLVEGANVTITDSGTDGNHVYTIAATGGGGGGLPADFDITGGTNAQVSKSGNVYTISATDTNTETVLTAGDNVSITDSGTGGNHNYRIDVGDAEPDDYMVYSKNPNIIITAMGNDQEENIFLYDASIGGATADNNQLSDFETGTDKIEIKGTSLPKGQLTQFATQGAGIYYSNGVLSYNDGTNVKTIVKVVDGSTVAAADVTII